MGLPGLASEVLGLVASYLDGYDVRKLELCGSRLLNTKLATAVTNLCCAVRCLEEFPSWLFSYSKLRQLEVKAVDGTRDTLLTQTSSGFLPPQVHESLYSLEFQFSPAVELLSDYHEPRTLRTMTPNLTYLNIDSRGNLRESWVHNLPKGLKTLRLAVAQSAHTWSSSTIRSLPRTLEVLSLTTTIACYKDDERDIWPPNIRVLEVSVTDLVCLLSVVPQTVDRLICSANTCDALHTSLLPQKVKELRIAVRVDILVVDVPLPPQISSFWLGRITSIMNAFGECVIQPYSGMVDETKWLELLRSSFPPNITHISDNIVIPWSWTASVFPNLKNWTFDAAKQSSFSFSSQRKDVESNSLQRFELEYLKHNKNENDSKESITGGEEAKESVDTFLPTKLARLSFSGNVSSRNVLEVLQSLSYGSLVDYTGPLGTEEQIRAILSAGSPLSSLSLVQGSSSTQQDTEIGKDLFHLPDYFWTHLGSTLVRLSVPVARFSSLRCLEQIGPQFRMLLLSISENYGEKETLALWSELPFPLSTTSLSIFSRSCVTVPHFWTVSSFAKFKSLRSLSIYQADTPTHAHTASTSKDCSSDPKKFKDCEKTEEQRDATSYLFFETLPKSLTGIETPIPASLSPLSVSKLPSSLFRLSIKFPLGTSLLTHWTIDHFTNLPRRLGYLNATFESVPPPSNAPLGRGISLKSLNDQLPPTLTRLLATPPSKIASLVSTPAMLLDASFTRRSTEVGKQEGQS